MVNIYYSHVTRQLSSCDYERYLEQIPRTMHQRITRYQRWQDRQTGLFSRLLLIKGLEAFAIQPAALHDLKYTNYKRPYLDKGIDFNISHSGDWVLCALSDTHQVGIDIEQVRSVLIADFEHVLSTAEKQQIEAAPNPYRFFYDLWTRKEAVAKAEGSGLLLPFQDINLDKDKARCRGNTWFLKKLPIAPDYSAHLAINALADEQPSLHKITFN